MQSINKKELVWFRNCPFCGKELKIIKKSKKSIFFDKIASKCHFCGAKSGKICPKCELFTWYKNGIFKHQYSLFCNFQGKFKGKKITIEQKIKKIDDFVKKSYK